MKYGQYDRKVMGHGRKRGEGNLRGATSENPRISMSAPQLLRTSERCKLLYGRKLAWQQEVVSWEGGRCTFTEIYSRGGKFAPSKKLHFIPLRARPSNVTSARETLISLRFHRIVKLNRMRNVRGSEHQTFVFKIGKLSKMGRRERDLWHDLSPPYSMRGAFGEGISMLCSCIIYTYIYDVDCCWEILFFKSVKVSLSFSLSLFPIHPRLQFVCPFSSIVLINDFQFIFS